MARRYRSWLLMLLCLALLCGCGKKPEEIQSAETSKPQTPPAAQEDVSADYVLLPDHQWRLLDEFGELTENYYVTILGQQPVEDFYAGKQISYGLEFKTLPYDGTVSLTLDAGYQYDLRFEDKLDPSRSFVLQVVISQTEGLAQVELETNFTSAYPPGAPRPGRNEVYAPIVQDVLNRCDPEESYGLILDINGDRIEELILQYVIRTDGPPNYVGHVEIWSRETGTPVKLLDSGEYKQYHTTGEVTGDFLVTQRGVLWMTQDRTIVCMANNSKGCSRRPIWGDPYDMWESRNQVFLEMGPEGFTQLLSFCKISVIGQYNYYMVNGVQVSEDVYEDAFFGEEMLLFGEENPSYSAIRPKTPLDQLLNELQ